MNDISDPTEGPEDDNKKAAAPVEDAPQTGLLREVVRFGGGVIVSGVATGFAANYFGNGCTNSGYMQNLPMIFIVSFVLWLGVFALLKNTGAAINPARRFFPTA